jgi:uncharacterized cupin superfamily protein
MPKIDVETAPLKIGGGYPPPFDARHKGLAERRLAEAAGLTQFGVNLVRIPPGDWSSQRHWHRAEDEFVWVLEGEAVLVTEDREDVMRAGECAGFPAGAANGHHFQNRSGADVLLLVIGSRRRDEDACFYPDTRTAFDARGPVPYEGGGS